VDSLLDEMFLAGDITMEEYIKLLYKYNSIIRSILVLRKYFKSKRYYFT
jgi:hypothetical protein